MRKRGSENDLSLPRFFCADRSVSGRHDQRAALPQAEVWRRAAAFNFFRLSTIEALLRSPSR